MPTPKAVYVCPHCQGKAFYLRETPVKGMANLSSNVVRLDGSTPNKGSLMSCDSCLHVLAGMSLANVHVLG